VGKAYHIKISDFGTDNELYAADYYKVDGTMALPVRWMAWESIFQVCGLCLAQKMKSLFLVSNIVCFRLSRSDIPCLG